jgi:hypothetical protein
MSIADTQRMREMQELLLDLLRRVSDLEKQTKERTLRLPKADK